VSQRINSAWIKEGISFNAVLIKAEFASRNVTELLEQFARVTCSSPLGLSACNLYRISLQVAKFDYFASSC